MSKFIQGLDKSQKNAVLHTNGPLLVLAGAGSGKTRVLTRRIARLVGEKHCRPENILAVTFTNKAAKEMKERITKLTSRATAGSMTISTFHSLGVKILREFGKSAGINPHFSILSDTDRLNILKQILRSTSKALSKENPGDFGFQISLAKNGSHTPKKFLTANPDKRKIYRVYNSYSNFLKKQNCVDFDDLLLLPLKILMTDKTALSEYRKQFKYISIDEFKDTNTVQMEITKLIAAPLQNIMVVGDDDQGIYSWRGGDITNIIQFPSVFKGCKTIVLNYNYRSTKQIVDAALEVVANNEKRKIKNVRSAFGDGALIETYKAENEIEEVKWVVEKIIDNVKNRAFSHKNHAILLRTNALMRRFEEELRIHRVPYQLIGSMSFFDRKEIMDVFAYLRFFANTNDELSLLRILKVPYKGITPSTMERLEELAGIRKISLWRAFEKYHDARMIQDIQKEKIKKLLSFYKKYHQKFKNGRISNSLRSLLTEVNYIETLKKAYKEEKSLSFRLENIEELIHATELFEKRYKGKKENILSKFIQEYALITNDNPDEGSKKNGVQLMTLHKSKGLEFPVVFLPILDDTVIPSRRSCEEGNIDEERRLFYVGMTRAEKELVLTCPREKLFRQNYKPVKPCRFIFEIPEEFMDGRFGEKEDEAHKQTCENLLSELKMKFKA